jgi:ribosomal protein L11 methyltransferase
MMYFRGMKYVKLCFDNVNDEQVDLISALLQDEAPLGFEQMGEQLYVYFSADGYDETKILEQLQPFSFSFTTSEIAHENWNQQWESNFEPIIINEQIGVRAAFHAPLSTCKYEIVITPKMSFGTGHHETTRMMLEYLCEVDCASKSVFDFGCGTGVLAIFAALRGATPVLGIDNDEWSVENARENADNNGGRAIQISGMSIEEVEGCYDLILANINLNILVDHCTSLKRLLSPGGTLILSGVLQSDIPALEKAFGECGLTLRSQKQKKDWVALLLN